MLRDGPLTVSELARQLDMSARDVADDLAHLERSLRRAGAALEVEPARCRKCGFRFAKEKLRKPGKCPACRGTWITEPRISLDSGA